jgi:vitamin B12 transporter
MSIIHSVPRAPGLRSALSMAISGLLLSNAWAESPVVQPLPEQVVTATRTPSRLNEVVADVSVIHREELAASVGQTLAQVLSRLGGIQISSNGGYGKNSSVFVRGGQTRHTLVLIDGVRMGSATTGAPSIDNLPLDAIERIEVVRGALASLYGSEAASGVIQIFTRRGGSGMTPSAQVTLGSDEFRAAEASLSGQEGRLRYLFGVSTLATEGISATNSKTAASGYHPDRDGFKQQAGQLNLSYQLHRDWLVAWSGLVSQGVNETDDGGAVTHPSLNTRADVRTSLGAVSVTGQLAAPWRVEARMARSYDGNNTIAARSTSSLSRFATEQEQFTLDNHVALPLGTLLVATDYLRQRVDSTQNYPVKLRTINAWLLGWSGSTGAHAWQTSARHDTNSQFGDKSTGSLAYGYEFLKGWQLGGSLATSFVAPSFNQLYFPGFGNPNLVPEEGVNREVSLKRSVAGGQARLAWFKNSIRGFLNNTATSATVIPRVEMEGWTLSTEQRWRVAGKDLSAQVSFDALDAVDVATGKKLQRRADLSSTGALSLSEGPWLLEASLKARDGMFDDTANTASKKLAGVGLFGLRAQYRFQKDWTWALRIDNVADRQYETAYGYNQPGRQAFLSLSWSPR